MKVNRLLYLLLCMSDSMFVCLVMLMMYSVCELFWDSDSLTTWQDLAQDSHISF
jgi:hypothetical protein